MIREEIDRFRELFKTWVSTFQKDEYEDEWEGEEEGGGGGVGGREAVPEGEHGISGKYRRQAGALGGVVVVLCVDMVQGLRVYKGKGCSEGLSVEKAASVQQVHAPAQRGRTVLIF